MLSAMPDRATALLATQLATSLLVVAESHRPDARRAGSWRLLELGVPPHAARQLASPP